MNKEYKIKLDLNKKLYNKKMAFNQFDENVNDFYIEVTKNNEVVKDLDKSIITLVAIKPNGEVDAQFIEVKEGQIYADLKPSMCDLVGNYQAKAMIVLEGKIVTTDTINYSVNEDKIISRLNEDVVSDERFTLFTDALARLSDIEASEEQRIVNEAERILSEENRKIEEAKRVEAELIRQHEEADRAKYDATRESNENIRKQNESIRLANETNRIDEESKRVEEENKRKLAEEERNANYNFMTEDEERRRSEANAHKEAEVSRVQAETDRVNEEAKRRTTEQARVSAENTRVNNENVREASEVVRVNNETQRVEAETQRQNRYNSFISDAEANANNFENYTNNAKVKEEERKANELDRKLQEDRRISNEVERISNENTRKANEVTREENEASRQNTFTNKVNEVDKKIVELNTTKDNFVSSINTKVDTKISEIEVAKSDMTNTVSNKVNEVETRFNRLTSQQQQSSEVIDARDGETSLKARLDRDIEKAKQVYVNVEGSHISTDSSVGYLKDVEILGNTIQDASNLADIRSVGDTVEGQELYEIPVLSVGKNLFDGILYDGSVKIEDGNVATNNHRVTTSFIKIIPNTNYVRNVLSGITNTWVAFYDNSKKFLGQSLCVTSHNFTSPSDAYYVRYSFEKTNLSNNETDKLFIKNNAQLEEGTVATPYEPYQEDKLTILSPVQLERVGDVADRIICKDGVWGVVKSNIDKLIKGNEDIVLSGTQNLTNVMRFHIQTSDSVKFDSDVFCDKFKSEISYNGDFEHIYINSAQRILFYIEKSKLTTQDVSGFKAWLQSNNVLVKYPINESTFIPLPHDQQVKLRTFANKTNISFLTEIEGTIKAQVPKSLGATVNTHTEQINNLNKELDRVKKLEESTVSTVTIESDFTTVEATSGGYFEDVKLEGKTLVNLIPNPISKSHFDVLHASISDNVISFTANGTSRNLAMKMDSLNLKPSTKYTMIVNTSKNTIVSSSNAFRFASNGIGRGDAYLTVIGGQASIEVGEVGTRIIPMITREEGNYSTSLMGFVPTHATSGEISFKICLIEGDHTQNPPSYFEGLKSVGQSASEDGVDEIVVSSVNNGNLAYNTIIEIGDITAKGENGTRTDRERTKGYIEVLPSSNIYTSPYPVNVYEYDSDYNFIRYVINVDNFKTSSNTKYIRCYQGIGYLSEIILAYSTDFKNQPHKQDKKRLLYYNNETQTWEKPILREWDSIEKHADGKYYYHQRSGEVVLNGSEDEGWSNHTASDNYISFMPGARVWDRNQIVVCDKFKSVVWGVVGATDEFIWSFTQSCGICIAKSKLSTQDVQGFKRWLQSNNVTVVYQLAQEKVYECTSIDLITYNGETNYVVESGAIVPKTTLKVHNNISNVVSLLQKKVSLLESNIKASQEVQDMMILETDMRMLDIELALMEFAPMTLNLGGSNMLRSATYFNFLKNHIVNETYEKEYLENVMNKYLATGRINQDEYNELYKMLYPPVYDIELPIEY